MMNLLLNAVRMIDVSEYLMRRWIHRHWTMRNRIRWDVVRRHTIG